MVVGGGGRGGREGGRGGRGRGRGRGRECVHLGKKRKEKNKITQPQEPDHRTHSRYQHSGHSRTSIPGRPSDRQALRQAGPQAGRPSGRLALRQAGPQAGWSSGRLVSTGEAAVDPCNWPATHDFPCSIKLQMPLSFIEALLPPFPLFHPLPSPPLLFALLF